MGAEPGTGAALPAQELGGSFALGRWRVHRAGYGAMQLAVDRVFGPPWDRDEALRVLRAAVAAGVDLADPGRLHPTAADPRTGRRSAPPRGNLSPPTG
jgi:hypothetical protein